MRSSRPVRFAAAMIALISVLFMQLAVAAYACPSLGGEESTRVVTVAAEQGGMPGCEGMVDLEQSALCFSHSQVGNQSLDKPLQPPVAPFATAELVLELAPVQAAFDFFSPVRAPLLSRETAPPLSVRHCCFRI